jgi:hypothetical protein
MRHRIKGPCGLLIADLKAQGYPPLPHVPEKPSAHSVWFGREILSSGVIGYEHENVAVGANGESRERTFYTKTQHYYTGRKGHPLKYSGPKLVQPHGTVLFHLARHAAGAQHGEDVVLETRAFLKSLGKGWNPDHADSRRKLWGVLKDLTKAHFTTSYVTEKERVKSAGTIIANAEEYSPLPGKHGPIARFVISFSKTGLEIFRSRPIRMSLAKRSQLKEGFETWLYGVMRASFARQEITFSHLYRLAALIEIKDAKKEKNRRKEFVRRVKAALRKMTTPKPGNKNGIFHVVVFSQRGFHLWKNSPTAGEINDMMAGYDSTVRE